MKLRKILYGLTLMLGCFVLASCVNEEEGPCLPEGKTKVLFKLTLPENAQTRAEAIRVNWGTGDLSNFEQGGDKDNYIDLSSIKMLIFDADNNYKGSLKDMIYTSNTEGTGYYEAKEYEFVGTAPDGLTENATYKFVVLANTTIPETPTVTNLNDLYFTQNTNAIPMWGVKTATLSLVPGELQDLEDIALLRAISKVTVQLSPEMITRGFTLESLQVDNYNNQGYVLPANAFSVAATTSLDQEGCVRPKTSAAQKLPGTVNNNSVELYLPEYKNIGSTKPATMSVTLKLTEEVEVIGEDGKPVIGEDGKPKTEIIVDEIPFQAGIKFMIYDANGVAIANSDYDIVRNHHYIFTITGAEVGHRLMLRVVDIPWDDAQKIEVDYTQTIGWKDSGEPNWSVTPVTEGEFEVINVEPGDTPTLTFTLDSPLGWEWLAVLEPLTDNANSFIQFQDGSSSATGSVGQPATLNFKITTDPASVNHRARLRLYVQTPGSPSREVEVKYIISRSY